MLTNDEFKYRSRYVGDEKYSMINTVVNACSEHKYQNQFKQELQDIANYDSCKEAHELERRSAIIAKREVQ